MPYPADQQNGREAGRVRVRLAVQPQERFSGKVATAMNPLYDDGNVSVYCGDAALLDFIPDGSVQLIVTSPPYNVEQDYGGDYDDRKPLSEYLALMDCWMREMYRVLRPGGVLALNVPFTIGLAVFYSGRFRKLKNRYQGTTTKKIAEGPQRSFPLASWSELRLIEVGFLLRRGITWVKSPWDGEAYATSLAMGNQENPFMRSASERILLASKDRYHRDGIKGHIPKDLIDFVKDVWHISSYNRNTVTQRPWERNGHSCPFPLALPSRLIRLFSNPGDLVLDPFCGTGTTLEAAKVLGRRAIGVDIVEKWCKVAADHCRQMVFTEALPTIEEISGSVPSTR